MQKIKPGDRVIIPFGLHELEATAIRVSDSGLGTRVTVELTIEGTDEPLTLTYPADEIVPVDTARPVPTNQPGAGGAPTPSAGART